MNASISRPGGPGPVRVGQLEIRYLLDGSSGKHLGVFELTVPPGSNVPPPHSHSANDEYIYMLKGTLRYTVGAETRDLMPGDGMFTPRGVVHGFSNPHGETAVGLITNTPDIGERYFRDIAEIVNAGGPPDKVKVMEVMTRYGLRPAAPPASPPA
jgi:quercetin dioxygenase-like cupin family protein